MDGQQAKALQECVDNEQLNTSNADEAASESEVEFLPIEEEIWLTAAEAADELEVKVRHIRRLATAGKILRKREDGRTLFCLNPLFEPEEATESPESNQRTSRKTADEVRAETGAILLTSDTGEHEVIKADDEDDEVDAEQLRQVLDAQSPENQNETVILDAGDVEYLDKDVVPEELLRTNKELMRLVEGVMARWTEAMKAGREDGSELKRAMTQTQELQQCLTHWQYHAATLERQVMASSFLASRALDVADEATSTRWTSGKRLSTLRERLGRLRTELGE